MTPRYRWMIAAAVAAVVGMYLMAKLRHTHRPVLSTPPYESLPMPPSTPDRG